MDVWSWLWLAWGLTFAGVEGAALIVKDRPGTPATLTANVRWLITGAGTWHHVARLALALLLGWLPFHFGLPFTDWSSVWPNIVASAILGVLSIPAMVRWFKNHQAKLHAAHAQVLAQHHEDLRDFVTALMHKQHAKLRDDLGIGHDPGA